MNKVAILGMACILAPATLANATESYAYRYGVTNTSAYGTPEQTAPYIPTVYPAQNPYPAQGGYPVQQAYPAQNPYPAQNGYPAVISNNPYNPAQPAIMQHPAMVQANTPAPHVAQYGFYRQKSGQAVRPQYIIGGNPYAVPYRSSSDNQNSYYNSPVFADDAPRRARRLYYAGARIGLSGVFTKSGNFVKPALGLFAGTWIKENVRADIEFDYHAKGNLKKHTTYQQYDLGGNVYYDFPMLSSGFRPFVGGGLWLVKKKTTASADSTSSSHSGWKLALSGSAGLTYPVTDHFSLSGMLRARYIVTSDSIYNLEALFGATYSW